MISHKLVIFWKSGLNINREVHGPLISGVILSLQRIPYTEYDKQYIITYLSSEYKIEDDGCGTNMRKCYCWDGRESIVHQPIYGGLAQMFLCTPKAWFFNLEKRVSSPFNFYDPRSSYDDLIMKILTREVPQPDDVLTFAMMGVIFGHFSRDKTFSENHFVEINGFWFELLFILASIKQFE